jgi:hypothetical protein
VRRTLRVLKRQQTVERRSEVAVRLRARKRLSVATYRDEVAVAVELACHDGAAVRRGAMAGFLHGKMTS